MAPAPERGSARVEVVYALPDRQRVVSLEWTEGMTAAQAIEASGLRREFPELSVSLEERIGVFGQRVPGTQRLRAGDRVEIYRPLEADPRDQRRRLAAGTRPASARSARGR